MKSRKKVKKILILKNVTLRAPVLEKNEGGTRACFRVKGMRREKKQRKGKREGKKKSSGNLPWTNKIKSTKKEITKKKKDLTTPCSKY